MLGLLFRPDYYQAVGGVKFPQPIFYKKSQVIEMGGRSPVKVRMNNLAQALSTASEATYSRHLIRGHTKQPLSPEHPGTSPPISSGMRKMA